MAAVDEKKNMLRLHVDDSQMEWVCEQHQKGKYLYTNACCNQVDIGLQRAFPTFSHESQQKGELKCSVNKMLKNMT